MTGKDTLTPLPLDLLLLKEIRLQGVFSFDSEAVRRAIALGGDQAVSLRAADHPSLPAGDQLVDSAERKTDMVNVLVTGGLGVNGSSVTRKLLERGHLPVVLENRPDPSLTRDIAGQFPVVEADITDLSALVAAAEEHSVERVVFMAALMPGQVQADPLLGFQVNAMGAVNVCEMARQVGIGRVVFTSSKAAYGEITAPEHRHPTTVRSGRATRAIRFWSMTSARSPPREWDVTTGATTASNSRRCGSARSTDRASSPTRQGIDPESADRERDGRRAFHGRAGRRPTR
ncbi:MAG: NAD-dependent epimerase/dehydratase family protein [Geodermatophilaceae bacterium]|nr:NAD-dependent epimerase/dehydratase family protein [Geodermatophilaceae bacterium]